MPSSARARSFRLRINLIIGNFVVLKLLVTLSMASTVVEGLASSYCGKVSHTSRAQAAGSVFFFAR
jgi:hypothetical protein